ncbi:MAG: zinc ribbon domain-containing protein [Candidatus Pacearchaeota archaeon]|nr:zinc ribbon domain-containing protein [Candidatus Pacearchaeota archaeon]
MFGKKIKCSCGKKVDASFSFCPYCGINLKAKLERDKALDREVKTMMKEVEDAFEMPFFMRFPFEKIVKRLVKDINKQFQEYDEMLATEKIKPEQVSGISISIKQGPEGEPIVQVKQFGNKQSEKEEIPVKTIKEKNNLKEPSKLKISEAEASKLAKLPRQEPETKVRRLSDKIVYEILLPGVKNEKDIIINKLQNSIEIKAFAKEKAYFKLIPLGLPIKNYKFDKETLILELKPNY